MGLFLLSNSVLVPFTANAQTIPLPVSTTTANIESVSTNPVSLVQEPSELPLTVAQAPVSLSVTLTSYNAVPAQTSPTPWITASGALSNSQVIAARSRDLANELPYGTIIAIMGPDSSDTSPSCGYDTVSHLIGYRVIADSMAARMHDKIDVMLNQHDTVPVNGQMMNPAVALGACTGTTIQVVGYVNPQNIPSTQAGLVALVNSNQNLAYAKF
jgi:3D (Asp-Asp-Asp) domain-containing protein